MAGHGARRRRGGGHESEHPDERWLVSYADMVTLLMALFIVMFAMANVNTSKFTELKKSLANAFSGPVKTGGGSILDGGASDKAVQGSILSQVGGQAATAGSAKLGRAGRRPTSCRSSRSASTPTRATRASPTSSARASSAAGWSSRS